VLKKNYNEKCDLWSCGVILFILLSGEPPFNGYTDEEIMNNVKTGEYNLKSRKWDKVSKEAKELITHLLTVDVNKRYTAEQALNHTWFKTHKSKDMFNEIKDQTIVRISFAYLYRIKIGNKYLLIKNDRGTGKYQPVGGVYKILGNEKLNLKNLYKVMDDDKIPIDESSRDDYRLRMENKYLRKFVRRFDKTNEREQIHNLRREFKEELIEKGIVDWNRISYRYCGRHISELRFGEHFQCYELLLADIVELLPTPEQEADLKRLLSQQSDTYYFATVDEIKALGINTDKGDLREIIADHSNKITQEAEGGLLMLPDVGKTYAVSL
jgi:serine/threonine protein kinase